MYALTPLQSWILVIGLIVLVVLVVTSVFGSPFDPIDEGDLEEDDVIDDSDPRYGPDVDWDAIPSYAGPDEIYDWAKSGL